MSSPPDPAAVTAAVHALAALERMDLNPMSRPPDAAPPGETPWTVLERAGPAALPEIEAAIAGATGTGRIALAQAALALDRARGEQIVARLKDDTTPAWVDTCLVGFRSVAQWARTLAPYPPVRAAPSPAGPRSTSRVLALVVAALIAAAVMIWLYRAP